MQSKQYFTKIKNYPHEKSTEPRIGNPDLPPNQCPTFFERQNESNKKAPKTIYLGAF